MTSPPYWKQEIYSESTEEQDLKTWKEDFLRSLFAKTRSCLVSGGAFAVNIRDIKDGQKIVPLEQFMLEAAQAEGFRLEAVWRMFRGHFGRSVAGQWEPIFVFRT